MSFHYVAEATISHVMHVLSYKLIICANWALFPEPVCYSIIIDAQVRSAVGKTCVATTYSSDNMLANWHDNNTSSTGAQRDVN